MDDMCKSVFLSVFFVVLCLPRQASALTYSREDSLRVVRLLDKAAGLPAEADRTLFFAREFIGTPYVASTLEVNRDEELVVNLRQLDCTTLVENVVALVLTSREARPSFGAFCRNLERIRYEGGVLDGYASRNHYFSEWIASNARQGIVEERTGKAEAGYRPFTAVQRLELDYMSTHPDAYPMLKGRPEEIRRIREKEKRMQDIEVRYVPRALLGKGKDVLGAIRDGDILAIVTRKKGLDTSHLGFAVWKDGRLHLLNASSIHKKVVLEPMTLWQYMQKHPSQLGVRVVRII